MGEISCKYVSDEEIISRIYKNTDYKNYKIIIIKSK